MPWGISIKSVIHDYQSKSKPPSKQPLQKINFIADTISDQFARMMDSPIISQTNTNSNFSLDQHHIFYPFLHDEKTMEFAVPEKALEGMKKEKYVPPKRPEVPAHMAVPSRKAKQATAKADESNAFFDNVTSHVVHDFKYPKWNRGNGRTSGENTPKLTTDHESFLTADESADPW